MSYKRVKQEVRGCLGCGQPLAQGQGITLGAYKIHVHDKGKCRMRHVQTLLERFQEWFEMQFPGKQAEQSPVQQLLNAHHRFQHFGKPSHVQALLEETAQCFVRWYNSRPEDQKDEQTLVNWFIMLYELSLLIGNGARQGVHWDRIIDTGNSATNYVIVLRLQEQGLPLELAA